MDDSHIQNMALCYSTNKYYACVNKNVMNLKNDLSHKVTQLYWINEWGLHVISYIIAYNVIAYVSHSLRVT